MSKLGKRVCLIHELRKGRGTEKFLYCRNNRTNIYKILRSQIFGVLHGHTLFYKLFHTGKSDSHLILKKLADTAKTSVTKMVDVINRTTAVSYAEHVVYGRINVVAGNMLWYKLISSLVERSDEFFFVACFIKNVAEYVYLNLFRNIQGRKIITFRNNAYFEHVRHFVRENFENAGIVNFLSI